MHNKKMNKIKNNSQEGTLQAAVIAALEVYCGRNKVNFRHHAPYANQQGDEMGRYCADVVAILDSSLIILLELKYLDTTTGKLPKFDAVQFSKNLRLAEIGVPIGYAYNSVIQVEYHNPARSEEYWPETTLSQVNRAEPEFLPDDTPVVQDHETLLDWIHDAILRGSGEAEAEVFGKLLGLSLEPALMKNGVLTLLYGVDKKTLHALDKKDLTRVHNYLSNNARLVPKHENVIKNILNAAADVFDQFSLQNSPPKKRSISKKNI
jgi:hypothetical protein